MDKNSDLLFDGAALNSLSLAFLGDAVYTLLTRQFLVNAGRVKIGELHKEATKIVNANAQAKVFDAIEPMLTQEEKDIARRARNVKSYNVPKSSSLEAYKKATSLEAVFGYNLFNENNKRLKELFKKAVEIYDYNRA